MRRRVAAFSAADSPDSTLGVAGLFVAQQPLFDGAHAFTLPAQLGDARVDRGQMSTGEREQIGRVGVDVGQRGTELAQQPDPVQPVDLHRVVVAAIAGVAFRGQQPQFLVAAQGSLRDACAPGDLANVSLIRFIQPTL